MKRYFFIFLILILFVSCKKNSTGVVVEDQNVTWELMTSISWAQYENLWIQSLIQNSQNHLFAASGNYIFRSIDEGLTWEKLDLDIMAGCKIVINSKDWLFAVNNSSLYVSKDNGNSWSRIGTGNSNIFIDPNDHIFMGNGVNNFKSTDDGNTWSVIDLDGWINGFHYAEPNYIFACRYFYGIYQSNDNGNSWVSITGNLNVNQNESDIRTMDVDSKGTIYIGTPDGLFTKKITDDVWEKVETLNSYIYSVKSCSNGQTFVAVDTIGAYYTSDNGITWQKNIEGLVTPHVYDFLEYKTGLLISINVVGEWYENSLFMRKIYY